MGEDESRRLFGRLKIRTLLDLALIVPSSYDDTRLSDSIEIGKTNTFEAVVRTRSSKAGQMRVEFFLTRFRRSIMAVFFNATPYHYRLFVEGSTHVIQGRVTQFKGSLQIVQPRSIKDHGRVVPRYKTPLKESEIRELIGRYITVGSLMREGLNEKEAAILYSLHFPDEKNRVSGDTLAEKRTIDTLKFTEAYNHMRKLSAKRHDYPALMPLRGSVASFIDSLPFDLTDDQKRAITEISEDLRRSDRAARRMIIGDVGSGKTMVILAAAVVAGSDRSLLMAPTSILAMQLYEEARKYLPADMKTALVIRDRTEGSYIDADFVIGTHALLYLDDLPPAALVMVDEQHRFGTRQRAMLEAMVSDGDKRPHYLQFSATPIPRTQAMMESRLVDVSLIEQTPFEKNISSHVIGRSDFPKLMKHIKSELSGGRQVLIVYPLVEESSEIPYQSIDEARGFWESRFEGVFVTHGKDREKEEILLRFRESGRILLATTVVEVGISLPLLSTVVIVGAERLGLATLHQLRGRVGRMGQESHCYLYTNDPDNERLRRFCSTMNGFEIARLDLAYRSSGDILDGTIQSGEKFRWFDPAEDERIVDEASMRLDRYKSST